MVSADNPASNAIGGFKQSTAAYRHCRHCLGTREEVKQEVQHSFVLDSPSLTCMHTYIQSQMHTKSKEHS